MFVNKKTVNNYVMSGGSMEWREMANSFPLNCWAVKVSAEGFAIQMLKA